MDALTIIAISVLLLGAMFGFIFLIDRSSQAQARTGHPSRLIRISAVLVGLAGLAVHYLLDVLSFWPFVPLSLLLLAYGVFGLFGTVPPRKRGHK